MFPFPQTILNEVQWRFLNWRDLKWIQGANLSTYFCFLPRSTHFRYLQLLNLPESGSKSPCRTFNHYKALSRVEDGGENSAGEDWQRERERGRSRVLGLGALLCKTSVHGFWSQTYRVRSLVGHSELCDCSRAAPCSAKWDYDSSCLWWSLWVSSLRTSPLHLFGNWPLPLTPFPSYPHGQEWSTRICKNICSLTKRLILREESLLPMTSCFWMDEMAGAAATNL